MSKLAGYKVGDRVRVTFEGEIFSLISGVEIIPDNGEDATPFEGCDVSAPSFSIKRLAKPYVPTVGDRVTWGTGATGWKLVAIEDDYAIIWNGLCANQVALNQLRPYEA